MAEDNANAGKDQPVVISATASGVTLDPQNPLPEGSFMWRRLFTAVIAANALVFVWFAANWLHGAGDMERLYSLTKLMIFGAGLVLTYYFIAPSASELTNMLATASIVKHSLTTATEKAVGLAESAAGARFGGSTAPESQKPGSGPGGPSTEPGAPAGISGEDDAAPRGRP